MMNNPQVIVALNNISKISDGKRILTKLDLETYDGESLTLQGSSSDGQTTAQAGQQHGQQDLERVLVWCGRGGHGAYRSDSELPHCEDMAK
ncbi:hypothetical protein CF137_21425 [Aeromonas sobria]|nr:hypothetical protein CF137_21425 [Aeromonas sobria]